MIPSRVQNLTPYTSARDLIQGDYTFLDANELPFDQYYTEELQAKLNRYPDPYSRGIKQALEQWTGVPQQHLFVGSGSDEILDLLVKALIDFGRDTMLNFSPSYSVYGILAENYSLPVTTLKLTPDFQLPWEELKTKLSNLTKIIWLCSPNNPTGNLLSQENIIRLLEQTTAYVVLDEAYIEFTLDEHGQDASLIPLLEKYPNLIIIRTCSKAWGLSGLRLGWAAASETVIEALNKVKEPYNVPILTQEIGAYFLQQPERMQQNVRHIQQLREELQQQLQQLGFKILPSVTNFFLLRLPESVNAKTIYQGLVNNHRLVLRDRSNLPHLQNCLRISVGTEEENQKLIQAFQKAF